MTSPFTSYVRGAIRRGADYLVSQQDKDGFWREFHLQPGASEAWTTAWVGWCLAGAEVDSRCRARAIESCRLAREALCHSKREGAWGYNRGTGPDADTIAWVLRFFSACGMRTDAAAYLAPYIDPGGGVHTFREASLGSWTDAHDDVAANAGLALFTDPSSRLLAARIKQRLVGRFPGQTFWWSTPTYGVAWAVRFLCACSRFSYDMRTTALNWLSGLPETDAAFEVAHRLLAVAELEGTTYASLALVNQLLDLAGPGGWPGSSLLLVPPREGGAQATSNAELRSLITTSICVRVLSEWVQRHTACGQDEAIKAVPYRKPDSRVAVMQTADHGLGSDPDHTAQLIG